MKIIVSPSKTQQTNKVLTMPMKNPLFQEKSREILKELQLLTKNELQDHMKISDNLVDYTYRNYQNHETIQANHAISTYQGIVFKQLNLKNYTTQQLDYLTNYVYILSAFYGVLRPNDAMKMYRLDMKMKINNIDLYDYWNDELNKKLISEDCIIDLCSKEYSKLIKVPTIQIIFKEQKDNNKYKVIATYAKQARGKMLNYLIENKVKTISKIKEFSQDGYRYNSNLSDNTKLIFTRKKNQ